MSQNIYEPDFVRKLFNQMSGSYEKMNYISSFGFSIRWRKQFLSKLGTSNEQLRVIDLLSGLGENWTYLKHNFPNSEFAALDFSEEMVRKSRLKANRIFQGGLSIFCQNVLKNDLKSENYDIVCCAYGLKTFNETQLEILSKEIFRILKNNGSFSFVEVSAPDNILLNFFYKFYLFKVIPIIGKLFVGNPQDYRMLWIYTDKFKNSLKAKEVFEKNGLSVYFDRYFFGCATGISGTKSAKSV